MVRLFSLGAQSLLEGSRREGRPAGDSLLCRGLKTRGREEVWTPKGNSQVVSNQERGGIGVLGSATEGRCGLKMEPSVDAREMEKLMMVGRSLVTPAQETQGHPPTQRRGLHT